LALAAALPSIAFHHVFAILLPSSQIDGRYLTIYYVMLMLCVAGTIFASAFCFLFAGKASEYVDKYYECIRAISGDRFGTSTNLSVGLPALICLVIMSLQAVPRKKHNPLLVETSILLVVCVLHAPYS
jgi:hypothetical protein